MTSSYAFVVVHHGCLPRPHRTARSCHRGRRSPFV